MFGDVEDGSEIVIEPLLDEDVTVDEECQQCLIKIRFGITAPKEQHKWNEKDEREFDGLERALASGERALQVEGTEALEKALRVSSEEKKPRRKLMARKKKRKKQEKKRGPFATFVKAAKFCRGMGAGMLHPSAKLRLFGLLVQAQHGDAQTNSKRSEILLRGLSGSALALQRLKLKAWCSEKGKSREDAMAEYVRILTSLVPQWKVAHLLGAHESIKDEKPRPMLWVLKVQFAGAAKRERLSNLKSASSIASSHLVTNIEVLQSSNISGAKIFNEDKIQGDGKRFGAISRGSNDDDLFHNNMPENLTAADCIVDKVKFKTLEEQREHFSQRMREMAHLGVVKEAKSNVGARGKGIVAISGPTSTQRNRKKMWTFLCKTNAKALAEGDQIDVYQRSVDWSPTKQLRSVIDTKLPIADIWARVCRDRMVIAKGVNKDRDGLDEIAKRYGASSKISAMVGSSSLYPFITVTKSDSIALMYRKINMPWYVNT